MEEMEMTAPRGKRETARQRRERERVEAEAGEWWDNMLAETIIKMGLLDLAKLPADPCEAVVTIVTIRRRRAA
jgi:hypothetical protein